MLPKTFQKVGSLASSLPPASSFGSQLCRNTSARMGSEGAGVLAFGSVLRHDILSRL